MECKEFLKLTTAEYRQVDYWIRNGIPIGVENFNGSGHRRSFSKTDAYICSILNSISLLAGGSQRAPMKPIDILKKVALALYESESLQFNQTPFTEGFFVTAYGDIHIKSPFITDGGYYIETRSLRELAKVY